ncbi:hypothetical protein K458DRAFT_404130 [Lentithecium fluviatile CBS 122367]|uniref:Uncharacterized protein n=1 Tax=Lentithecium fluviatile CBS 122367 TaxID=1168545 RepID=A0A6G1J2T3_9PLEO|nr:hypothetical protein K458DRAFT_404130 [Lentithecium fluviatile CBS 122367]
MLFGLLHYRTQFSPQDWAAFDSKVLTLGWASGGFDLDFNRSSVFMYGERHRRLTPWNADQMHRADTLGFPHARLVLEAESTLLCLLRRLVEISSSPMMHRYPPQSRTKWSQLASKKSDDKAYWSRFAYQPFRHPRALMSSACWHRRRLVLTRLAIISGSKLNQHISGITSAISKSVH